MNKLPGIYGKKLGCMTVFTDDGSAKTVTVVEAGPVIVVSKRTKEKDGYSALVLGLGERKEKHTTKPLAGQFKKANATPKRLLKELRCEEDFAAKFEVGATMKLDEIFQAGQFVDAQAKTRGRGFTGVIRRWSMAGQVSSHGTHEYFRHGGSIGTNMTPGRTLPNMKMPGQFGNEVVTVHNQKIHRVDADKHMILIEGAVPGARNGVVMIRHAIKKSIKRGGGKR
jgi:large subunit ribosomal protein L3